MGVPRNPQHGITPADPADSGYSPRRPQAGPPGATTKRVEGGSSPVLVTNARRAPQSPAPTSDSGIFSWYTEAAGAS